MGIENLNKGTLIGIGSEKFQIVEVWEDLEISDKKEREILDLGLVKIGKKRMTITHRLIYYYDTRNLLLKNLALGIDKEIKKEEIKEISS